MLNGHSIYEPYFEITVLLAKIMVECTFHKGYSLTLYFKSHDREDSKKEIEVVKKMIMAISLVTNLLPVVNVEQELRESLKGKELGCLSVLPLSLNKNTAKYINIAKHRFRKQILNQDSDH